MDVLCRGFSIWIRNLVVFCCTKICKSGIRLLSHPTIDGHFAGGIHDPRSKRPKQRQGKVAAGRIVRELRRNETRRRCSQVDEVAAYGTLTLVIILGRYHV